MVKFHILVVLILFSSITYGQKSKSKSKIKFIDGSELHVVIIENFPGKYVKILLPENEEVTIKYSSILSIKHNDYSYYSKYVRTKGFYIEGASSILFGKASEYEDSRLGVSLGATVNYQLNSHLSIGIGAAPTAILITNEKIIIPLYTHFKYNILERRVAPVLILDTGWSFIINNKDEFNSINNKGGWYARPALGIQISKLTLSLGYQLQKISTTTEFNSWWMPNQVTVEDRLMKNITLNINLRF